MKSYEEAAEIKAIIDDSKTIVIVQADNPDTDSLASALALESVLAAQGKEVYLYCGVDMPSYLHHLPGWGRVSKDLPKQFDASIIVDTSSDILLEQLEKNGGKSWLAARPSIILDHHASEPTISFAKVILHPKAVSTGEIIYELARQFGWQLDKEAKDLIAMSILSDSLGLMSESTSPRSINIIAELVEQGVNLPQLESARRETFRREPELIHYKGELLKRVEFYNDNKIAMLSIPWEEIERYSALYNPSMLVIDDMRLARGTALAICFKLYPDKKITAKIRANYGWEIADKLAEHFGGGGHPLASGFKVIDGRSFAQVKKETTEVAAKLISELEERQAYETV